MAHPDGLSQWATQVAKGMPQLSPAQARVLAWWSYGIVFTRSCVCSTVAVFLGLVLGKGYHALRQCLREWCYDAADKRGAKRQTLGGRTSFAPRLGWVLHLWRGQQLALALDATSLGERFVVSTVSVVYRGCAIPVAWRVLPANRPGAWRREWLRPPRQPRPAVPAHFEVLVLADRGLYARWLFGRIVRLGWHPFLRVNRGGKFQPAGQGRWVWFGDLVPQVGGAWAGQGHAFVPRQSRLACWEPGHRDAWFILTDLPPSACHARLYGVRTWIEQGFKVLKRGGWQWQQTRMTDPARAERPWLALAVATLWVIRVGDAFEQEPDLPVLQDLVASAARGRRPRLVRLFRLGHLTLLAALATRRPLPLPRRLSAQAWASAGCGATPPIPPPCADHAA